MFCNLKELTLEELVGQLRVAEDRFEPSLEQVTEKAGKLLLTEEEWVARNKSRMTYQTSSSGKNGGGGHYGKRDKQKQRSGGDARDGGVKLTLMGTP
jgi:hypothetical protein